MTWAVSSADVCGGSIAQPLGSLASVWCIHRLCLPIYFELFHFRVAFGALWHFIAKRSPQAPKSATEMAHNTVKQKTCRRKIDCQPMISSAINLIRDSAIQSMLAFCSMTCQGFRARSVHCFRCVLLQALLHLPWVWGLHHHHHHHHHRQLGSSTANQPR